MTEKEVASTPPPSTPQKGGAVHVDRSPLSCSKPRIRRLTPKQAMFIKEYEADFNATRAAEAAGYKGRVGQIGYQLLQIPLIKNELDRNAEERLKKIGVRAERVLQEMTRVALSDLRKVYRDDGSLKLPQDWDEDTAAAISGVEVTEEFVGKGDERVSVGFTRKVKVFDKVRAIEMLAKHLQLFPTEKEKADKNQLDELVKVLSQGPAEKNPEA